MTRLKLQKLTLLLKRTIDLNLLLRIQILRSRRFWRSYKRVSLRCWIIRRITKQKTRIQESWEFKITGVKILKISYHQHQTTNQQRQRTLLQTSLEVFSLSLAAYLTNNLLPHQKESPKILLTSHSPKLNLKKVKITPKKLLGLFRNLIDLEWWDAAVTEALTLWS